MTKGRLKKRDSERDRACVSDLLRFELVQRAEPRAKPTAGLQRVRIRRMQTLTCRAVAEPAARRDSADLIVFVVAPDAPAQLGAAARGRARGRSSSAAAAARLFALGEKLGVGVLLHEAQLPLKLSTLVVKRHHNPRAVTLIARARHRALKVPTTTALDSPMPATPTTTVLTRAASVHHFLRPVRPGLGRALFPTWRWRRRRCIATTTTTAAAAVLAAGDAARVAL